MKILWSVLTVLVLLSGSKAVPSTTQKLKNGCIITYPESVEPDQDFEITSYHKDQLPHLDCSGVGRERFDLSDVVNTTKSITFSDNEMIEFYIDDLERFPHLESIKFKNNKLSRLIPSSKELVLSKVYQIFLNGNKLQTIPNEALKTFPNLKILSLSNNKISTLDNDDFKYNLKMDYLLLGYNPLEMPMNSKWLNRLSLVYIVIRSCGLTKIPIEIRDQTKMKAIDFSDNLITEVEEEQFINCEELWYISLTANQISRIDPNAFTGANKLNLIEISDNQIERIEEGTFDNVKLTELSLEMYANPFICDCKMAWFKQWHDSLLVTDTALSIRYKCEQPASVHNKGPQHLTLDDYKCVEDDPYYQACNNTFIPTPKSPQVEEPEDFSCPDGCSCFDKNGQLYSGPTEEKMSWYPWDHSHYPRVDCLDTNYKSIPTSQLPIDMKMLLMNNNSIVSFNVKDLRKFKNLTSITLKHNQIRYFISDSQTNLPQVTTLYLQYNKINSISSRHLRSFPNLTRLAIYHNRITTIPRDLFKYTKKINRIYMGPNPILRFDESFLKGLKLKSLSLRNMSLSKIPGNVIRMTNITYLDLSENMITVIRNGSFSNHRKLWRLDLEKNLIKKIEAGAFNGTMKLRGLLLSENRLLNLPGKVFSNMSVESLDVELWENPFFCDCRMKDFQIWLQKRQMDDPTTDINFHCYGPSKLQGYLSDELSSDQFVCNKETEEEYNNIINPIPSVTYDDIETCPSPNGQFAIVIFLTFIITLLICLACWKICFRAKYGHLLRYAKQRRGNYEDETVLADEEY